MAILTPSVKEEKEKTIGDVIFASVGTHEVTSAQLP
jgi:hypothetical protein